MEAVQLIYTSPAIPSDGIEMNKSYVLGKDDEGSFIEGHGLKNYYDYKLIQMMFTPLGKTWEEIDTPVVKSSKKNK